MESVLKRKGPCESVGTIDRPNRTWNDLSCEERTKHAQIANLWLGRRRRGVLALAALDVLERIRDVDLTRRKESWPLVGDPTHAWKASAETARASAPLSPRFSRARPTPAKFSESPSVRPSSRRHDALVRRKRVSRPPRQDEPALSLRRRRRTPRADVRSDALRDGRLLPTRNSWTDLDCG